MRWSADQSFKRHLYEEEKSLHRDYSYAMECISDKATTQNALHIKKSLSVVNSILQYLGPLDRRCQAQIACLKITAMEWRKSLKCLNREEMSPP